MTTKEQFEQMVSGPGKFEGEHPWTPYFWNLVLDGDGETVYREESLEEAEDPAIEPEIEYDRFRIMSDDAEIFPELDAFLGHEIRVWEDSQGFVYSKICSVKD